MNYLKSHWPELMTSLLGGFFAVGFAWAALGARVAGAERRLDEIDYSHVSQTRWQVEQNTVDLAASRAEARQTQAALALVHTRLGIIETKIDVLSESVTRNVSRRD